MKEYCSDVIAYLGDEIVVIERLSNPKGLAFPGGRKEPGETFAQCAMREFREETGLSLEIEEEIGIYDSPDRDPRGKKISTLFWGTAKGTPRDEPGKTKVLTLTLKELRRRKNELVFDHALMLESLISLR